MNSIRQGHSTSADPVQAVEEFWRSVEQPDMSAVILFCCPSHDLEAVAARINSLAGDVPVIGCTTAGELTPKGYRSGAITGLSLARPDFHMHAALIEGVRNFEVESYDGFVHSAIEEIKQQASEIGGDQLFSLLLVDGLCTQEEALVSCLYNSLGDIPLFGASAGDNLRFRGTQVLYGGEFRDDVAIFAMFGTRCPFRVFKTEHFVGTDSKMVVTRADPTHRVVTEINGDPAAQEYARLVGLPEENLSPMAFAAHPVVVRVGGEYYVRSIQKVNEDNSLTFFCAIDEGIVLTLARSVGLVDNLRQTFNDLRREIGDIQLVVACDCILRRLELEQNGQAESITGVLRDNNVVGFNTYGEQFLAMHVNQTFTGVAIGYS